MGVAPEGFVRDQWCVFGLRKRGKNEYKNQQQTV